jgi:hypothetical protein
MVCPVSFCGCDGDCCVSASWGLDSPLYISCGYNRRLKIPAIIGLVILAAIGIGFLIRSRYPRRASPSSSPEVYLGLRAQILESSRSKSSLPPTSTSTEPWGVVMDWGVTEATASVVALSDGHASIYLSNGGGYLGGAQSHESIRKDAQKAVAAAKECRDQMRATTAYPLPSRGEVIFYLLTDEGVVTASASQEELSGHQHPLSKLGDAMQEIITEYRRIQ